VRSGLIGYPLGHSRLAPLMDAAYAAAGLSWRYELLETPPQAFAGVVAGLREQQFVGANVTMPHKLAAHALADELSPAAREIGAVNTLVVTDGAVIGDNTDAGGVLDALGRSPRGLRTLVLGAGGAARAAAWALRSAGAADVAIWNRTPARSRELADELGLRAVERPVPADVVVNATSVGMDRSIDVVTACTLLSLTSVAPPRLLLDLVYGPHPTPLCNWATAGGGSAVDGLEVLLCQGMRSFRRWTGQTASAAAMRAVAARIWDPPAAA
jgi:shikimate dehydrogenase